MKNKMMEFAACGMKCIPVGGGEDHGKYAWSHYVIVEAENDTSDVRFQWKYGDGGNQGDYWVVGPEDGVILDNLKYNSLRKLPDRYGGGYVDYTPALNFKVGNDDTSGIDTVGYLLIEAISSWMLAFDTLAEYPIVGDFTPGQDTLYIFTEFSFEDHPYVSKPVFSIKSSNYCSLYVDYIKVYDEWGIELIEENEYNDDILAFVDPATNTWVDSCVISWYLHDEPHYDQFMPFRYIDSLIYANTSIRSTTYYSNSVAKIGYKDFIDIAQPEIPWYDIYSFYGGQVCWSVDTITGDTS